MARVVNPRRHLVDHQRRGGIGAEIEHLDCQKADVAESFRNGPGDAARLGGMFRRQRGRDRRRIEDAVLVRVRRHVIEARLAIDAAHDEHRDLVLEIDEAFENGRRFSEAFESRFQLRAFRDARLALAVVAHAARFQDALLAHGRDGLGEIRLAVDGRKRRHGNAEAADEALFLEAVLRNRERFRPWPNGRHGLGGGCGGERNVLELIGDDIDARGEARDLGGVVEVSDDGAGGNVECGARQRQNRCGT